MVQRAAVALWTPEVAAALCERKSMLPPSGMNLGLRALFSNGVKHTDCCSCAREFDCCMPCNKSVTYFIEGELQLFLLKCQT